MRALVQFSRGRLLADMEDITVSPITVIDDGLTRVVTALRSASYGYNRHERTFFAGIREDSGHWRNVPASDPNTIIFDTYLPLRAWRRRIRYTLRARAFQRLIDLANQADSALNEDHDLDLRDLCFAFVERAWRGLQMRKRMRAMLPTKAVRHQIREALQVDPGVLALARAARFRTHYHAMNQKWLSFVWQHRIVLERIRAQTPTLLSTVAQHMFQHGATPGADPTKECVKWLIRAGVSKRTYRLLAKHSARPFRMVIARFTDAQSLDALVLALSMTESGHDAGTPRPLFYRLTMDEFGRTMTPCRIIERFAPVPKRVFTEARDRLDGAKDAQALRDAALEYRAIVDWWVACTPQEHAQGSWGRWVALARAEDARHRAAMDASSWPCALEELKTPVGEVLALSSSLSLFEEGRALRHCVYAYLEKCRQDRVRLFSARIRHEGRIERATIGLQRGPRGWRIWEIRGACNRRVGGHWIPLARKVAETYTRLDGSEQLALPVHCTLAGDDHAGQ